MGGKRKEPVGMSNLGLRSSYGSFTDEKEEQDQDVEQGQNLNLEQDQDQNEMELQARYTAQVKQIFTALNAVTVGWPDDSIFKTEQHLLKFVPDQKPAFFSPGKDVKRFMKEVAQLESKDYDQVFELAAKENIIKDSLEQWLDTIIGRHGNAFAAKNNCLSDLKNKLNDLITLYQFYAKQSLQLNKEDKFVLDQLQVLQGCIQSQLDFQEYTKNAYKYAVKDVLAALDNVEEGSITGTGLYLENLAKIREWVSFSPREEVQEFIRQISLLEDKDFDPSLDANTKATIIKKLFEQKFKDNSFSYQQQEKYLSDLSAYLFKLNDLYQQYYNHVKQYCSEDVEDFRQQQKMQKLVSQQLQFLHSCVEYQLAPLRKHEPIVLEESGFFDFFINRPILSLVLFVGVPILAAVLFVFLAGPVGLIIGGSIIAAQLLVALSVGAYNLCKLMVTRPGVEDISMKQFLYHDPDALPLDLDKGSKTDPYNTHTNSSLVRIKRESKVVNIYAQLEIKPPEAHRELVSALAGPIRKAPGRNIHFYEPELTTSRRSSVSESSMTPDTDREPASPDSESESKRQP